MLGVTNSSRMPLRKNSFQYGFAFNDCLLSKVVSVEVQQVKSIENYRALAGNFPGTQSSKARQALFIEGYNLAVTI
jgi:hypothetical protein